MFQISVVAKAADTESEHKINDPATAGQREVGGVCAMVNLKRNKHQIAREKLITAMLEGHTFQEVSGGSPMPEKQSMAYHLLRAIRIKGSMALSDERYGHPINYVEKRALFSKPPAERLPARRIPSFRPLYESALVST